MFFAESSIFNNGNIEIMAPSPKNNNPNIYASFLIISKLLFIFCSLITSSSYLDTSFMLGGIYILETFLDTSITFLGLCFWEILMGRPYEIIRFGIAIVRRSSLEVINFL